MRGSVVGRRVHAIVRLRLNAKQANKLLKKHSTIVRSWVSQAPPPGTSPIISDYHHSRKGYLEPIAFAD
jgi:hypothetical protein